MNRINNLLERLERVKRTQEMEQALPADPLSASLAECYKEMSEDDLRRLAAALRSDS